MLRLSSIVTATLLAVTLFAAIGQVKALELVYNGNFGADFAGWTKTGNTNVIGEGLGIGPSGGNAAGFFGGSSAPGDQGIISQSLSTTAGHTYNVTLLVDDYNGTAGTDNFRGSLGGTNLFDLSNVYVTPVFGPYTPISFVFQATAPSSLLQFTGFSSGSNKGWVFTNISVTEAPAPTPEASTSISLGILLCLGLVSMGLSATRSKRVGRSDIGGAVG
ncbi:MAG TPA: hypothetical protein VGK19_22185 [Capsulimonadaceae bacterium]